MKFTHYPKDVRPITNGPARFAVGPPSGLTSNAWRFWSYKGSVYISCRDNFKEAKVSLHARGRWRMGFTSEAIEQNPTLVQPGENRAWEVWDEPPATLPDTVKAFQLVFPTSELVVEPDQRIAKDWKDVMFIEAAPPGKLTVLTVFVSTCNSSPIHESEPCFPVAALEFEEDRYAYLIAHGDPAGDMPTFLNQNVEQARAQATAAGVSLPDTSYGYFFGRNPDGSRFLVGASMNPLVVR